MKKYVLAVVVALGLFTTPALAGSDAIYSPDYNHTSTLQIQALDDGTDTMITLLHFNNGSGPQMIAEPAYFYVGTSKFTDLMAAKATQTDMTTVQSTLAGLGTPFSGAYSDLTGKPLLFSGAYTDLTGKPSLFSGAYTDLTGKPALATVATSGTYSDLSGKPTIPTVPTVVSAFTDDAGYITASSLSPYLTTSTATSTYVAKTTTVNGHALSGNVNVTTTDLGLAAVATSGSYNDLSSKPTINNTTVYDGTTARSNPVIVYKSSTVASGIATFYITADNTSTGTALCQNGIIAPSVNPIVNDATAAYQMSWAWTNSNKTLTVTANKLTTANILTGILGQGSANGASINIAVACY